MEAQGLVGDKHVPKHHQQHQLHQGDPQARLLIAAHRLRLLAMTLTHVHCSLLTPANRVVFCVDKQQVCICVARCSAGLLPFWRCWLLPCMQAALPYSVRQPWSSVVCLICWHCAGGTQNSAPQRHQWSSTATTPQRQQHPPPRPHHLQQQLQQQESSAPPCAFSQQWQWQRSWRSTHKHHCERRRWDTAELAAAADSWRRSSSQKSSRGGGAGE